MKKQLACILAMSLSSMAYSQGEPPAKEVACRACHGASGAAPLVPNYPKLNGQNKQYLVSSLKAYRAGERKGGLSMVMASQASGLSDADIEALASYYAAQK